MWKSSLLVALGLLAVAAAKQRVCVIGAGPAGLTATKFLADYPDEFETVTFEKGSDVGGMWIYTESQTIDENGLPVHSSAYQLLRVNVPKELLAFPEYPQFGGENVSFVRHDDVLQYLRNYTDHFNLRQYIKFNTNVEKVLPLPDLKWMVIVRDLKTKKVEQVACDATVVSNGHNVKGVIPRIAGIESFSGKILHSHLYRKPEEFTGQTVVVLGASYSGQEIAAQVSKYAKTVYLSHRHDKLTTEFPSNVVQVVGVTGADGKELILSDGSRVTADSMIYATGFQYEFPFLDESSGIKVDRKHIQYLYKHLINIERPTMAILNVPMPRLAFQQPHSQSAYFIALLRGKVTLPSHDEMLKSAELPAGTKNSEAHVVNAGVFQYYNDLAVAAGYDTLPLWFQAASDETTKRIFSDPLHFRDYNLVLDLANAAQPYTWVPHNQPLTSQ